MVYPPTLTNTPLERPGRSGLRSELSTPRSSVWNAMTRVPLALHPGVLLRNISCPIPHSKGPSAATKTCSTLGSVQSSHRQLSRGCPMPGGTLWHRHRPHSRGRARSGLWPPGQRIPRARVWKSSGGSLPCDRQRGGGCN